MTRQQASRRTKFKSVAGRILKSWYFPTALSLVLIAVVAFWLFPRRVEKVVTVDGEHEWNASESPARRQFVWKPATALEAVQQALREKPEFEKANFIRPHLTDAGSTLYFTVRKPDGGADIYVSRFVNGRWNTPHPVKELNTEADDIGLSVTADGSQAYFYSNRPGGIGGFDLYVSQREKNGWSKPQNLGPLVNTPAHEYDPALSPDGTRLFFASNRTKKMQARISEMVQADGKKQWSATLRAQPGLGQFDLYVAKRNDAHAEWASALPLTKVNRSDSNEGAPAVAPNGVYLYFASDRSGGQGGYDLYRARLRDGDDASEVQNLGPSVNTAAHEMEPAVSPEGFRLVFSSDREQPGEQYALYESRAVEVTNEVAWDDTNWQAFTAAWGDIWIWALLATLLLAALFLVLRQYSTKVSEKTVAARFFLSSLLVHLLLLLMAAFWTIGRAVLEEREQIIEMISDVKISNPSSHESHEKGLEAFEKLADLKAIDEKAVPPKERAVEQAMNIPNRRERLEPMIPAQRAKQLPPDKVILQPKDREPAPRKQVELQRRPNPLNRKVALLRQENIQLKKEEEIAEQPIAENANDKPRKAVPVNPRPVDQGVKIPRQINGSALKAIAKARESQPAKTASPKVKLLAQHTVPRTEPIQPKTDGNESQLLAKSPAAKEKPVAPGQSGGKKAENNLPAAPNSAKTEGKIAESKPRPGQLDTAGAKKRLPKLLPKAKSGIKLARFDNLKAKPAGLDDGRETLLAKNDPQGKDQSIDGDKAAERGKQTSLNAPVRTPKTAAGPRDPLKKDLIIGKLDRKRINAPPAFGKRASRLLHRRAKALPVALARENAGMREMFTLRNPDFRKKMIKVIGATDESEKSVTRGLHWIALHQMPDGRWSLNQFNKACKGHQKCTGHGQSASDTAATGFALLPFLARGQTHQKGEYRQVIDRGLNWLMEHQKKDGDLFTGGTGNAHMYSHGVATIALCEAYGLTQDPKLKESAQKAVNFIVKAQHKSSGGWRYRPNQSGDTSVVGWQVMALKSAEMSGLKVPPQTLKLAGKWLDSVESKGGRYGYSGRGATPAMSAEGLLCRQFLGMQRDDPRMKAGADYLLQNMPGPGRLTSYYWYYATQVLYHIQGDRWKKWIKGTQSTLVKSQTKTGRMAGTWEPRDQWEKSGGRLYATAMKLLILEVHYRHLPLYQQLRD